MKKEVPKHILEGGEVYQAIIDDIIRTKTEEKNSSFNIPITLRKKDCDLRVIIIAILSVHEKWNKKMNLSDTQVDFSSILAKRKEYITRRKAINSALTTLSKLKSPLQRSESPLDKALFLFIDKRLSPLKENVKAFKMFIDVYLRELYQEDYTPQDMDYIRALESNPKIRRQFYGTNKKGKYSLMRPIPKDENKNKGRITDTVKLKQSTHDVWNESTVNIVNELRRIGYDEGDEFRKTAQIFNHFFPKIYTDLNPRLVRKKYNTYKRNFS
jgi:hypothetical protein